MSLIVEVTVCALLFLVRGAAGFEPAQSLTGIRVTDPLRPISSGTEVPGSPHRRCRRRPCGGRVYGIGNCSSVELRSHKIAKLFVNLWEDIRGDGRIRTCIRSFGGITDNLRPDSGGTEVPETSHRRFGRKSLCRASVWHR